MRAENDILHAGPFRAEWGGDCYLVYFAHTCIGTLDEYGGGFEPACNEITIYLPELLAFLELKRLVIEHA